MALPPLPPRMIQGHDAAGLRVNAGKIGPLTVVAMMAGQSEIIEPVRAAVLLGDDVFDMKAVIRFVVLVQAAVFAAAPSPLPHAAVFDTLHLRPGFCFNMRRALAWIIAMKFPNRI